MCYLSQITAERWWGTLWRPSPFMKSSCQTLNTTCWSVSRLLCTQTRSLMAISMCCFCPLVFRGWKWHRRCSRAQVAGLAISSARPWCVLATLHNHISPLSEQQGCCAAQQQRQQQQQRKLLELSRAAADLLTESFCANLFFQFWMSPSSCVHYWGGCDVNYHTFGATHFECLEPHESYFWDRVNSKVLRLSV